MGRREDLTRQYDDRQYDDRPDHVLPPAEHCYPSTGQLASALANHFGEGFSANFIDDYAQPPIVYPPSDAPTPHPSSGVTAPPTHVSVSAYDPDRSRELDRRFDNLFSSPPATGLSGDQDVFPHTRNDTFSDAFAEAFAADLSADFPADLPAHLNDSFDQELARQFGDFSHGGTEAGVPGDALAARPLGMRGLHWLRRNMTSLRVIVSLQRVTPPEPPEFRPRKDPRNGTL